MDIELVRRETVGSMYDADQHGNINFTVGPRGRGKTHNVVRHANILSEDYDIGSFITNIMYEGDLDKSPIYFCSTFRDLWKNIAEVRMDNPFEKIMTKIDEFQETVHRFRSTSAESVIFDRWFRQLRKQSITANLITQNTYSSIPINILYQGDWIFMKHEDILDEFNRTTSTEELWELNDRMDPESDVSYPEEKWTKDREEGQWVSDRQMYMMKNDPRFGKRFAKPPKDPSNKKPEGVWDYDGRAKALTFCVDVSRNIYKQVYPEIQDIDWKDLKQFKEYKVTLHDVSEIMQPTKCDWTDPEKPGPTYKTGAYATFKILPLNGRDPNTWVPDFMNEIGGLDQEELPQAVLDYFEEHETEDGLSLTPFEDLSDSRKAVIIFRTSGRTDRRTLSKRDAGGIFGITGEAVRKAERDWDDYMMEKHIEKFLKEREVREEDGNQNKKPNQPTGVAP